MRFAVIPISTKSVYIHCIRHNSPTLVSVASNYHPTLLKSSSTSAKDTASEGSYHSITIPSSTKPRLDDRLVTRASKLWTSFETSPTKWKQTLVKTINGLLERLPYSESSLRSIPAQSSVLRRKNAAIDTESHISYDEYEKLKVNGQSRTPPASITTSKDSLALSPAAHIIEPISVYYPSSILSSDQSFAAMRALSLHGRQIHLRNLIGCILFLPLTMPVALLPVIPNVPGFYLIYRAWCNFRAWEGAKHLDYLTEDVIKVHEVSKEDAANTSQVEISQENKETKTSETVDDEGNTIKGHLIFRPSKLLDSLYLEQSSTISGAITAPIPRYQGKSEANEQLKYIDQVEAALKKKKDEKINASEFSETLILTEEMTKNVEALVESEKSSLHSELVKAIHQTKNRIEQLKKLE